MAATPRLPALPHGCRTTVQQTRLPGSSRSKIVILPILAEGITAGRSVSAGGDGMAVGALEFAQGPSDVARVDFVLARPLWGKGLMTEAVAEVIGWAFHALPELSSILSGGL